MITVTLVILSSLLWPGKKTGIRTKFHHRSETANT